jgi:hypothetical protein
MGAHTVVRRALPILLLAACGGGGKKADTKATDTASKPAPPKVETEEDRAKKRHDQALGIVPEGSKCLPAALKEDNAPKLEIVAVGQDAIVCAIDTDKSRLLGPVGCWKVDLKSGALSYQEPTPLPGHNVDVMMDDHCARGYCAPADAKIASAKVAHLSWSYPEPTKVAMLVGDDVHVFDAASKKLENSFPVKGDKGVTGDPIAVFYVSDAIFVEGSDQGPFSGVWQFKADGTVGGPLVSIGKDEKPLSTYHGSFLVLDKDHIAVAERGFTTMTTYEVSSGKRTKAVRKLGKVNCKPDELEAYWKDGEKVSEKCKGSATTQFGTLIGATGFMGSTSLVVMLRDDRLGELAVMDPKSLAEKKAIKLPWCAAEGEAKPEGGSGGKGEDKDVKKPGSPPPPPTPAPAPAAKKKAGGDPDEGGQ